MSIIRNALGKFKSLSPAVKASVWFTICSVLQKGGGLITTPIFTRIMATQQYGQVTLYHTWYSFFAVFTTLNMDVGSFNNSMLKYKDNRDDYVSSMQGLTTVITLAFAFIYFCNPTFFNNLVGLSTEIMTVMLSALLFLPAVMFWSAKLRFEYKYIPLVVTSLLVTVFTPILGIIMVLYAEDKGLARIFAFGIVDVTRGGITYIYNLIKSRKIFVKEYWKFSLSFSIPLIPHYLSLIILGQSDRIMIEKLQSVDMVALYSVAYSIAMAMNIITTSINASLIPWTYQRMESKDTDLIQKNVTLVVAFVAIISLLPALFAPEVIYIMAPKEYAEAIWVIPPLSSAVFFTFIYTLFTNIEFYYEASKFSAVATLMAAAVNIVLNAMLIPTFGYAAAGYTTMTSYVLLAIVHYAFMKKTLRKNNLDVPLYNDKAILVISIAHIAVIAFMLILYKNNIARYAVMAVTLIMIFIKRKNIFDLYKNIRMGS